ncbi:hypothetical protein P0D69_33005 [Paraburkholderia sediminicola]|uniref:hypothetical protein n=1 Tax=Paraburkholderia sediminicola TaxID=458836 RepID=UPI0038B704B9
MQVKQYEWFEETATSNRYAVVMAGHNKQKIAKILRAVKAELGDCPYIGINLVAVQVFQKHIDLKTLKFGPSLQSGHQYQAEIDFYINDPAAAALAIQFKLTHF